MLTPHKLRQHAIDFKEIKSHYEVFKTSFKNYLTTKKLEEVFEVSANPKVLFTVAGYDFGVHIQPFIINQKMYGEVNFYRIYENGEVGEDLKKLFIGTNGRIYLKIDQEGPNDLDMDVKNLDPDPSFSDGKSLINSILIPLAQELFEPFNHDTD
ncbi:hypothetical protein ACSMFS_02775 [Shewanella xiamenensis]|uniref:hypothetical protein n=1 Tax=Shewanella xiamenensis TaxID=332186 RepID=UPI003F1D2192